MVRRIPIAVLAAALLLVTSGPPSPAVITPIDMVNLTGPGPTVWDPYQTYACIDFGAAYVPAYDGAYNGLTDAFDSALVLLVNSVPFADGDGNGDHVGQTLKVGPSTVSKLVITRTTTALQTRPTLRDLVMLKNPTNKNLERIVIFETNLGSDDDTFVQTTGSGNGVVEPTDRWVLSTEGNTSPYGDPIVTHAFSGKNAETSSHVSLVNNECLVGAMLVRVPAKSKRYLLLYLEMHANDDLAGAKQHAKHYNKTGLNKALLTGLKPGIRKKVLNWDLA